MKYGLSEEQLAEIIAFLKRYPEVEEAILFGSRAMDTYKEASDIDIAIKGERVNAELAATIKFDLEEDTYLPFFFDVIAYPTITNQALIEHIDTKGIRLFGGEWQEGVLSDIADIIMGQSPEGETCSDNVQETPLLNGPTEFGVRFPIPVQYTNSPKKFSKIGDILFCVRGSTTGRMNWSNREYALGRGLAAIRHNQGLEFRYFVKGIIDFYLPLLLSSATGSTFPNISRNQLEELEIFYPPLPEQKAIANVLSSLDDKIDLLHRQNKTLEAMAETLFRQWFIEEAQDDWENLPIDVIVSLKGGGTPSTKQSSYWDGQISWSSPRDLSNHSSVFLFDTERKITTEGLSQISSGLLPTGTVLLSSRAPIGYLAITDIPVAINQGYIAIICDGFVSQYFMYLWCKTNMDYIKSVGNGATFEEVSKSSFRELIVSVPHRSILDNFDEKVGPLFSKIKTNKKQLIVLEKLRDTLLPKLMSGEVRVAYDQQDAA